MRLRDAGIVRDVLLDLMDLVHGGGPWPELATELHQMTEGLPSQLPQDGSNGEACLVSNAGHNEPLLRARDKLKTNLLLVSHRLGTHYDCAALLPLAAACRSRRVNARMLYSKNEHGEGRTSSQLEREGWDEDAIVVTSQNWMSCDPAFSNLVQELGVAIDAPGAARHLIELIERELRAPPVRRRRDRAV